MKAIRVLTLCVASAALAADVSASASTRPDLAITKLTSPSSAVPGGPLAAKATVHASASVASSTVVGFFLSKDRNRSKDDAALIGGQFVSPLRGGRSSASDAVVFLPRSAKTGRYYLLACADAARRVAETNENNNCRASKRKLTVRRAPAPVHVAPHLATTGSTSQLVTAASGATLATTGPDGSKYSLTIPPKALPSDTRVTMTPIASIGGLPFTGAVAGVDLKPDGLMLITPAHLSISPAHAPPAARLVTVGWHAGSQELYLDPPDLEKGLVLDIGHFSGHEVVTGTPAQVQAQQQHPPIQTRDQLSQAVADAAQAARNALLAGHDDVSAMLRDSLSVVYQSYYDNYIKGLVASAKTDDTRATAALTESFDWIADIVRLSLVGQPGEPGDPGLSKRMNELTSELFAVLDNALTRAGERCAKGDLGQIVRLEALEGFAQKLGTTSGDAIAKAKQCLHFELDYNGTWEAREPSAPGQPDQVSAFTTKIAGLKLAGRLDTSEEPAEVTQVLQYPTYSWTAANNCHGALASTDETSPFRVISLDVGADMTETVDKQGRSSFRTGPPKVTLQIDPGQRTENVPYTCNAGGGMNHFHWFDIIFKRFHASELTTAPIYKVTDWTPGGGDGIVATKTYSPPTYENVFSYTEKSTFVLRHTA